MWRLYVYYFLLQWYENTRGVVEFLSEWSDMVTAEEIRYGGVVFISCMVVIIVHRGVDFFRGHPDKRNKWVDKIIDEYFWWMRK